MNNTENASNNATSKDVEVKVVEPKSIINDADCKYKISAPLFIMFAEYLGYVGKTLSWVDDWCALKKKPKPYQIKFIEVEASLVLKEALKEYTKERLYALYEALYDAILFIYDANLEKAK